jgi:hypothetical protein
MLNRVGYSFIWMIVGFVISITIRASGSFWLSSFTVLKLFPIGNSTQKTWVWVNFVPFWNRFYPFWNFFTVITCFTFLLIGLAGKLPGTKH